MRANIGIFAALGLSIRESEQRGKHTWEVCRSRAFEKVR
jgi:hypothetical protein